MRFYSTFIALLIGMVVFTAFTPEGKKKRVPKVKTFFACKQHGKIAMSAEEFLKYIKQSFCAKDSLDSLYQIVSFDMNYAETGLFQDEAGLPIEHTDYSFGAFKGDKIDEGWSKLFEAHAYKGDTIRFNNVLVRGSDSLTYRSSNIELVIR